MPNGSLHAARCLQCPVADMSVTRAATVFVLLLLVGIPGAHAQSGLHLGIGGGPTFYRPAGNDAERSRGVGFVYRWHSFHSGWGPTVAVDWHRATFTQSIGRSTTPLGSLRMRAIPIGVGHTQ